MFTPNVEQVKSGLRWVGATFGGAVIGWGTSKGWDVSGLLSVFNAEAAVGTAASVIMLIWGVIAKTKTGLVAAAATVPEVKKIEIGPTSTGKASVEIASAIVKGTSPIVVAAPRQ